MKLLSVKQEQIKSLKARMAKRRTKEEQARIDHAVALIQRGLDLIQEGDSQLRSRHIAYTNPLAGLEVLGHTSEGLGRRFEKPKEIKRYNARSGTRNSVDSAQRTGRARIPRAARRR